MENITIYGVVSSLEFQRARVMCDLIQQSDPHFHFQAFGITPSEYMNVLAKIKHVVGGDILEFEEPCVAYQGLCAIDDIKTFIGGWKELLQLGGETRNYVDIRPPQLYEVLAKQQYKELLLARNHPLVYCSISRKDNVTLANVPIGRVIIELYEEYCPNACQRFQQLCESMYAGTRFHRVVPGGWIQGGDCVDSSGAHSSTQQFKDGQPDESFALRHDEAGVVGFANNGSAHSNGTQFYMTTSSLPHLNQRCCAFGKIIEGLDVLKQLELGKTNAKGGPLEDIVFEKGGLWDYASELEL
eukprot:GCRY01003840.1.p1 GENE.GCRY01003840.1~~GCRY01003840.1.p1  ORF type:complete len:299 (+),score=46.78 GCRY01003840.1:179-1075(+)